MSARPQRLTAAFVARVDTEGKYYDEHGLYLRVGPNLRRYFEQRVTVDGRRRYLGLGSYPVMTLAQARLIAMENLRMARSGIDPVAERRRRKAPSLVDALRADLVKRGKSWTDPRSVESRLSVVERYIPQHIGNRSISTILSEDIYNLLVPLAKKHVHVARRLRLDLRDVMDWVVVKGYRQDNPVAHVTNRVVEAGISHPAVVHALAIEHQRVGHAWRVVEEARGDPAVALWFEMLVLTATRSSQVRLAAWSEFDFQKRLWTVPGIRMKNKRPHRVPVSSALLGVLGRIRTAFPDSEFLIRSKVGTPFKTTRLSGLLRELDIGAQPHGFRTTFSNWADENKVEHRTSQLCLAHGPRCQTVAAYLRGDQLDMRRPVMEEWGTYVLKRVDEARALAAGGVGA